MKDAILAVAAATAVCLACGTGGGPTAAPATPPGGPASSPAPTSTASAVPTTASDPTSGAVAATAWDIEPGVRVESVSAPATLQLPDGTYRMYLPGLETQRSTDGLAWDARQRIALAEPGEFLRNPAVAILDDGTFVMIYEGVKDENGPSRSTRFYRATSRDGIQFKKTPGSGTNGAVLEPIASDKAFVSAPDMVLLPGARLRLYFNTDDGATIDVADSSDGGLIWKRLGPATVDGLGRRKAADPDVLLDGDGTFRLFFAAGEIGVPEPRIFTAVSSDGLHFVLAPREILEPAKQGTFRVDPEVVRLPSGKLRLYFAQASSGAGPYSILSATSR